MTHILSQCLSSNARIVTRDNVDYRLATKQYASDSNDTAWAQENLSPAAIVYCCTEADVAATICAATGLDPPIHLSVRSGGHSYSGHSSRTRQAGGWIVDVSELNFIELQDKTVMRIGPGAKLQRIQESLFEHGRWLSSIPTTWSRSYHTPKTSIERKSWLVRETLP
jgi:FAD/FMN-containing dehydrogenase